MNAQHLPESLLKPSRTKRLFADRFFFSSFMRILVYLVIERKIKADPQRPRTRNISVAREIYNSHEVFLTQ